jgi:valyl-tRNA synthetase
MHFQFVRDLVNTRAVPFTSTKFAAFKNRTQMADTPGKYSPAAIEQKWYDHWMKHNYFHAEPDSTKESYTIVIPPPNVTGVLHMGHMLNNTIQDVLVRKARLEGKNACWVPGTDHASIATEAKVVAKLKAEGINKWDITREEFLSHAWDWTHKHGGIILEQLKKLGASCDWDRTAFTMDEARSESVIRVFVDLYKKGLIYRGYRMVNWDPEAKTTVSDEEVIYKDVQGKLYYLKYKVVGTDEFITVATTRPETILGDVAVCVNPEDERYHHLKGKKVIVPIANREVPIIEDSYVDLEFGTGALKITPAHDINDKEIGEKYDLEIIDILDDSGKLNEHGLHYQGKDRFIVRKEIAKELEEKGLMLKIEDYQNSVGTSERTGAVIEPKLSLQWFLNMKDLAAPALENVLNDEVKFFPKKFVNTYRHWMENVRDWNISRQLYWGHQIPAWFYGEGDDDYVVALNEEEAIKAASEKTGKSVSASDLTQDPDVLDTWFSSWLWPISVFDGIRNPDNEDFNYFYPTKVLVTAPEILFFWVARMIMAGYEYVEKKPFDAVYLTGIVRDKQGRKMSKSLGNSPDPIELMEKYGADGVRVGMLLSSPAGNDLLFDEDLCKQGSFFSNKIWNAMRLVKMWEVDENIDQPENATKAIHWFESRFNEALTELNKSFDKYRMSEALMNVYRLTWDDFCSWYLEAVKPEYGKPMDAKTYQQTLLFFEGLLKVLHPFIPFITEEIWHLLCDRKGDDTIMFKQWPQGGKIDEQAISGFAYLEEAITAIRTLRKEKNIAQKEVLELFVLPGNNHRTDMDALLKHMGNISVIHAVDAEIADAFSFQVGATTYYVPASGLIDVEEEIARIEKELSYQQGFLQSVSKKLGNERFVQNAPPIVVENERKKLADAQSKIDALQERLNSLRKA